MNKTPTKINPAGRGRTLCVRRAPCHARIAAFLLLALAILAGCGGGGGGGGGGGATQITVSGFASVPAGSSLARAASANRSAEAVTGLVNAEDGTYVGIFTMSSTGALSAALVSTTVKSGAFSVTLPSSVTALTSDLVAVVGSCATECMHGFVTKTTGVLVNPISEFVEQQIVAEGESLSFYSLTELDNIYTAANNAASSQNINFSTDASVSAGVTRLSSNSTVLSATQNAIATAACGSTGTFFLYVSNPAADGEIVNSSTVTVTGSTLACGASVTVNGAAVTVDSSGNFSSNVSISSNPTTITVTATYSGTTLTVSRSVYYQNQSACTLVYTATDPRNGLIRIYDVDPSIPNSARRISDDVANSTDSAPALSPNRSTVAFIRNLAGNQYVYTIACTGAATATRITNIAGVHYESVSWKKDGTTLAYAADLSNDYDIFTVPASSGQTPTQITTHAAADTSPTWLPTGEIVFVSSRDTAGGSGAIAQTHLWKVNPSNTSSPTILYDPASAGAPACSAGAGKCSSSSPDANSSGVLIFLLATPCSLARMAEASPDIPSGTCYNLYYHLSSSAYPTAASTGANIYLHPRWSETAASVVFINRNAGSDSLYYLPFSGSTPSSSVSLGLTGGAPDW